MTTTDTAPGDICPASSGGKHSPDPRTLSIYSDGEDFYIDVACSGCGQSGCAGKFDPTNIDW